MISPPSFGVTNKHVRDLRVIMNAPRGVRDLIRDGKIAAYEAINQLRKDPSGEKIMEAAAKAEAKAEANLAKKAEKLTRKNLEANGEKPPRNTVTTVRFGFAVEAGAEFQYEDVEPYMGLLEDDETWFKGTRSPKKKIALSDIKIEVKIIRAKTAEEWQRKTKPPPRSPLRKRRRRLPKRRARRSLPLPWTMNSVRMKTRKKRTICPRTKRVMPMLPTFGHSA